MKAVILAGGLGTRISEETSVRPKPMVEIGGKPILWHIMKIYSAHGINDFVICCGYKGYVIKEYFANYFLHMSDVTFDMQHNKMEVHQRYAEPWRVTLVDTGEETMTGGRLKRVADYVKDDEAFCFTYGDGVSDVDIAELIAFHKRTEGQGHRDRDHPARPLRRAGHDGRQGQQLPRKAQGRRRVDQRRLLRAVAESHRLHRAMTRRSGSASRWSGWRKKASLRPITTTASGSRWIRCATRCISKNCGNPARRRGRCGNECGLLARQARLPHRTHRLQGQLAVPVAAAAGRRGDGLCAAAADQAEFVRSGQCRAGHDQHHRRHPRCCAR